MKLYWQIKGKYQRIPIDENSSQSNSFTNIINDIHHIATQQKRANISTIRESFGLEFLPSHVVNNLLANNFSQTDISIKSTPEFNFQPRQFRYQFIPDESQKIDIFHFPYHNQQIPPDLVDNCDGYYQLELSLNSDNITIQEIWRRALDEINHLLSENSLIIIDNFLKNSQKKEVLIALKNNCFALLDIKNLSPELQEAVNILRDNVSSFSDNPLVVTYQQKYLSVSPLDIIPLLPENQYTNGDKEIIVNKGKHRNLLSDLIIKAEKFLLISSYRLEDENIISLVASKVSQLPFGVWILTDFSDKLINIVDSNIEEENENNLKYASSNEKKKLCLDLLAKAKIGFRSGNFHLKTYISEKSAYLGSCNLTGGSLSRNIEAGIIFSHCQEYKLLINYFNHLWRDKTEAVILPKMPDFQIQSLIPKNTTINLNNCLLNSSQYENDLTISLEKFSRNPQGKVIIATRNFQPNSQQTNLLKGLPCKIYYSNFNGSDLPAKQISLLHSKIIIIGNQVAYVSSQDFSFNYSNFFDLTYKITDKEEISQVRQQLAELLTNNRLY